MKFINEYREGQQFSGVYLCKTKQTLKTKAGKNYYSVVLQDKTGTVDAKIWELNNGINDFEAMDYIHVDGQVTVFQGCHQVNINRVRKGQEGEYVPDDYVPCTTKDRKEMFQELIGFMNNVKNPYLKALLDSFFVNDKDFVQRFVAHSAAKSVHHGFMGGLLEHTLGVTRISSFLASTYPIVSYDLLITAAVFHDIGKMEEISTFPENDYTDDGQMLGHIFIGAEKLRCRIREIVGFPKKLENELVHCILAHHGELEYGSPKKPAIAEAVALYYADNVDAKMETLTEIFAGDIGVNCEWVGYNRLFESNLRRSSLSLEK